MTRRSEKREQEENGTGQKSDQRTGKENIGEKTEASKKEGKESILCKVLLSAYFALSQKGLMPACFVQTAEFIEGGVYFLVIV